MNAKSAKNRSEHVGWLLFIGVVGIITVGGYFLVYPQTLYKPGERLFDFGYNLGLAGGLMMLTLLLYSARKRFKFLEKIGALPFWFKGHMILGILGPLTIIFHSTYHVYIPFIHPQGSINAAVAMLCMLLVSGSGTFGRFFYTKIHHGLYGRQSSLNEVSTSVDEAGDIKTLLSFAPELERKLLEFRVKAEAHAKHSGMGFAHFFTVGFQAMMLRRSAAKELWAVMLAQAKEQNAGTANAAEIAQKFVEYKATVADYINAVRDLAQFQTYERLFSWWHIFHIPLVYMMVFSAFYHVYAVHAY
ncbi:MAG: hypothetical protein WC742_07890 [Gallionellaceae bacterium]|jgi:hypothetical protein